MATNKHASIRYGVLDSLLRKGSVNNTQEMLRRACSDGVAERDPDYDLAEISLRTLRSDIRFLKDEASRHGVSLLSRRGPNGYYYFYDDPDYSYFQNALSDTEVGQLKCAMELLSRFKGLPEYEHIADISSNLVKKYGITSGGQTYVEYEHVESTGEEMMSDICNFIIRQQPIIITYMPYGKPEKKWIIHPYLLKEYNNRWFLFGYNETENRISNVALDRICADYEPAIREFIPNTFVDFGSYFDDVVGVTVNDHPLSMIELRASEERYPYILSKPIHKSQVLKDPANHIFSINVIPNRELDSLVLSFGADLEVVSPDWYRERISKMIVASYIIYSGEQEGCIPDADLCGANHV